MLEVEVIMARRCTGEKPCDPTYIPRQQPWMMINLSGEEGDVLPEKPTLSDIIANHFDHEDKLGACADCGGTRTAKEQIGSFPEVLLVQLNRTSMTGKKIETHVYLTEQLNIETRFMDERWGNHRKVVQYKLTSVVLHHGKDATEGHYSIGVKGKGDEWSQANDEQILDWVPEGPGGNPIHLPTGSLFTYRRLPTGDEDEEVQTQKPQTEGTDPFLSGSNAFDPKELGKFLDLMVPKVVDSYIARSADARHKEWEKWANEWEKKRGKAHKVQAAKTSTSATGSATGPATGPATGSAIGSAIGSDVDTSSNEDIVDWEKQRGQLQITLTGDGGKGARVLDLEVQGLHYNRLKLKRKKEGKADEEEGKEKDSTFKKIKKKVEGKAKEYGSGKGKKKKK